MPTIIQTQVHTGFLELSHSENKPSCKQALSLIGSEEWRRRKAKSHPPIHLLLRRKILGMLINHYSNVNRSTDSCLLIDIKISIYIKYKYLKYTTTNWRVPNTSFSWSTNSFFFIITITTLYHPGKKSEIPLSITRKGILQSDWHGFKSRLCHLLPLRLSKYLNPPEA